MPKKIAVFGSAVLTSGNDEYIVAEEAGKIIAANQFAILCGGYGGIMEAVCKGASSIGGNCEGVGLKIFENKPNSYINTFQTPDTLGARLDYFMENSDLFLALAGGIGTITEVMFVWDNLKARKIQKPIFLFGVQWKKYIKILKNHFIINPKQFKNLKVIVSLKKLNKELKKI